MLDKTVVLSGIKRAACCMLIAKPNWLTVFREIIKVYCGNPTKLGKIQTFLMLKHMAHGIMQPNFTFLACKGVMSDRAGNQELVDLDNQASALLCFGWCDVTWRDTFCRTFLC